MKAYKLKKMIKSVGGGTLQKLIIWMLIKTGYNNKILLFSKHKAYDKIVNINYWRDNKNIGDAISPVVVKYACKYYGIDIEKQISALKHLYAIGSIITAGCQDCTIWGSGILNSTITDRVKRRKLDIRAVRGPITRIILSDYGFNVPEVYGDPAILMPRIYNPDIEKKYDVGVVIHMSNTTSSAKEFHQIDIVTDDYETFIKEIKSCKLVVSSSLHGIILSEVYGVPAIMLKPETDLLKYYDYYYSTGRLNFPIAESIEQALSLNAPDIPDFGNMGDHLLAVFPRDLWE